VPVPAVNVPAVPLRKPPPTFKVPAPEKTIRESMPAEVMLPGMVAVPNGA